MVRLAFQPHLQRADADDRVDDAQDFPGAVEHGALLDVQFYEGGKSIGRNGRHLGYFCGAAAHFPEGAAFRVASAVDGAEGCPAAPYFAAREPAESAFLVLEGDDRDARTVSRLRGAGEFQPRCHSERAVEPSPERLRVAMGAHQDCRTFARGHAEKVARQVDAHLQARLPHRACEPTARRDVGVREGRARHARAGCADGAEVVERCQHAGGVNRRD